MNVIWKPSRKPIYSRFSYRPQLATTSTLVLVSKQVRDEFIGMLYLAAPIICTTGRNFDFRHIVTYLNRLSQVEIEKLSPDDEPPERSTSILLLVKDDYDRMTPYLGLWVNRVELPSKRGTKIDFQYAVSSTASNWIMTFEPHWTTRIPLRGRGSIEWKKIQSALQHECAVRRQRAVLQL
ncbi:hypothetical protein LTR36_005293 [Oleoguttula mirabilis]|uniref:Uncharacterized protein n=1 Tax=Oleoguttula mirabilis TaxID=1507867 RepID=A0AAV9JEJ6_9PEZI|nr:hypothetical protein LTR36_005293 [Oleoguttula mirabilis]